MGHCSLLFGSGSNLLVLINDHAHRAKDVLQRLLVFDLGDDTGFAALLLQQELEMLDVAGLAGEAEGEKIRADADLDAIVSWSARLRTASPNWSSSPSPCSICGA